MSSAKFEQVEYYLLPISEPSAITFISREVGFLVFADDASTIWRVRLPEPAEQQPKVEPFRVDSDALRDIESANYDPETGVLRVLSERSRRVYELGLTVDSNGGLALGPPRRRRRLKRVQRSANSGYEGFTTLPARFSPDGKKWNVAVNEQKPRRVCFFDPKTLKFEGFAKLPNAAKGLFPDLSSVTVAHDGSLFLLSDEGACFGEFVLSRSTKSRRWRLHLLTHTPIASESLPLGGARRLQPEGMTFDADGDLWIVAEANSLLLHFRRSSQVRVTPSSFQRQNSSKCHPISS